ncbi:hypothetical protein [Duganella callida]|uniref:Uncharacterized protein n=1 Tax=Duganella callida TaxID=2561932 RepID=A0A4Y9SC65_9BURK|nr:hypothetical protein [Duganella callida]TFW17258.1 hypothetical protein E4L98_21040 [Duganella callida]
MNDISESEARSLLASFTYCEMDRDWMPEKIQPGTYTLAAGLLDKDGVGTRMQVELRFRRSHKTGLISYVFSVFKRTPHGTERVYQLDVRHSKKPIKNLHDKSHEHMGSRRSEGQEFWLHWQFEDVLQYFCNTTNIIMSPGPNHPEHFELKG